MLSYRHAFHAGNAADVHKHWVLCLLLAHLLATGQHHDTSAPFDLKRFAEGRLIDEAAGSGISH